MRRHTGWVLVALSGMAANRGVSQEKRPFPTDALWQARAAGVAVRVIEVNMNDPRVQVSVQTARGLPHGAESFSTLLARTHPTLAINGTYFSKADLEPIGDIVVRGKVLNRGFMGTALAITDDRQCEVRRLRRGEEPDWKGYQSVLACGPALVLNGKIDVTPEEEGFHDPHIMGSARRMGIGVTPGGRLLLVQTLEAVTFRKWADVMLSLGCRGAVNLDAGASTAMYYRGKILTAPGRELTNIFAVYIDRPLPDMAALAPGPDNSPGFAAGERNKTFSSPADPGNASGANTVTVKLCGDTFQKATDFCPTTVLRRVSKSKKLRSCPLHSTPSGGR